jgi:hypothetical protein
MLPLVGATIREIAAVQTRVVRLVVLYCSNAAHRHNQQFRWNS